MSAGDGSNTARGGTQYILYYFTYSSVLKIKINRGDMHGEVTNCTDIENHVPDWLDSKAAYVIERLYYQPMDDME